MNIVCSNYFIDFRFEGKSVVQYLDINKIKYLFYFFQEQIL